MAIGMIESELDMASLESKIKDAHNKVGKAATMTKQQLEMENAILKQMIFDIQTELDICRNEKHNSDAVFTAIGAIRSTANSFESRLEHSKTIARLRNE